jgi:hypothetical protein
VVSTLNVHELINDQATMLVEHGRAAIAVTATPVFVVCSKCARKARSMACTAQEDVRDNPC